MHIAADIALLVLVTLLAISASLFTSGFLAGMGLVGWLKMRMLRNRKPSSTYPRRQNAEKN